MSARATKSAGWFKRAQWRLHWLAYVGVEALMGVLPGGAVHWFGERVGGAIWRFSAKRRRVVLRNLRIVLAGEKTLPEIERMAEAACQRAGANLMGALRLPRVDAAGKLRSVEVVGEERFREVASEGRGVIMVLAHMGNWELLAEVFPRLMPKGVRGATVYRPLANPYVNARVEARRARAGVGLFSKKDSPLAMAGFLKAGGVLGVLSDQRAGAGGEVAPYFGRLTSCSPLPALFARRTGAAVFCLAMRTITPGHWRIELREWPRGEKPPTTPEIIRAMEACMRESITDCFWLQERWRPNRRDPLRLEGKDTGWITGWNRIRRVLLWGAGEEDSTPGVWPDADVVFERVGPKEAGVCGDDENRIVELLRARDKAGALPYECVVAKADASAALARACKAAGVALVRGTAG